MHLVTCTCGREYNADELIRCPVCSTLTHDVVKASTASTANEAKATTLPGASAARTASTGNPTSQGSVDAASIQMMEKAFKSALRSANTDQTEYLRKIHFWMRYFGIVTIAGGVIALLGFVILVANAM